jgi:hypothetical protein
MLYSVRTTAISYDRGGEASALPTGFEKSKLKKGEKY